VKVERWDNMKATKWVEEKAAWKGKRWVVNWAHL
jgi:hypothetical protein